MTAAAILKNRKVAITLQRIDGLWRNLASWCITALQTVSFCQYKLKILKIQNDGRER